MHFAIRGPLPLRFTYTSTSVQSHTGEVIYRHARGRLSQRVHRLPRANDAVQWVAIDEVPVVGCV